MELNVGVPGAPGGRGSGGADGEEAAAYTDGEALYLATLGTGALTGLAVGAVVVSEPDRRSPAAANQLARILFWFVLLLTLGDKRWAAQQCPPTPAHTHTHTST